MSVIYNADWELLFLYSLQPDSNLSHLLVGGRPEGTESHFETARREAGEEVGLVIEPQDVIGYRHFHQIEPRSELSDRPWPDFIEAILLSKLVRTDRSLIKNDDQLPFSFVPFSAVYEAIIPSQRRILDEIRNIVAQQGGPPDALPLRTT